MPITSLPGYVAAVRNYRASPATIKAIAPTQAQRNVLGPAFGGAGGWGVVSSGGAATNVNLGYRAPAATGGGGTRVTTVRTPMQVYQDEILNDPQSLGAQQAYDATTQQLANTRRAQFHEALISSGYDPGALPADLADYSGDIDQATRDAAAANQLSGRAQLNKALNQSTSDLPYLLAARGVARSGELPVGQTSLQEQYQAQAQQGLSDLLSTLRGYGSDYASQFNQAGMSLNSIREAVAQRLAQQKGYSEQVTSEDLGGGPGTYEEGLGGGYAPMYAPTAQPQLQTSDPRTAAAIAGILGPRPKKIPTNIFQIARNVRAG
jgi:hypothetical protein